MLASFFQKSGYRPILGQQSMLGNSAQHGMALWAAEVDTSIWPCPEKTHTHTRPLTPLFIYFSFFFILFYDHLMGMVHNALDN